MKSYYYSALLIISLGTLCHPLAGGQRLKKLFKNLYSSLQQDLEIIGSKIKDKRNPLKSPGDINQYIDGDKVLEPALQSIRIMTFNLPEVDHGKRTALVGTGAPWPERRKYFVDVFNTFKPDIIGTQEANADILNSIINGTPKIPYKWIGKKEERTGYNAIIYNPEKLELLEQNTLGLNPEGIIGRKYPEDTNYARIYTYALFKDKQTGKTFGVINTHLISPSNATRVQGQFLVGKAKELFTDKNIPAFFIGDLNLSTSSANAITKDAGFINTQPLAEQKIGAEYSYAGWAGDGASYTLDHIFYNQKANLKVPQYMIVQRKDNARPSDHRPVFIDAILS